MKKYVPFPSIAFLLLTMTLFVFTGCGAKQTPPMPTSTAEAPPAQESQKTPEPPELAEDDKHHDSSEEESEHEGAEEHEASPVEEETHHEPEMPERLSTVEIPSSSVLHLIPEQALGVIYCPSLIELDNRINMLAMDLLPVAEPPEVLAGILARTFGAAFESLAELEEIGLDLNQDFAIFMTDLKSPDLSAIVHLTEPEAMRQVIEAESEGTAPVEYNGVTYWNAAGGGGSFTIIDNTLVFTRSPEVCENVIDTANQTKGAITADPNYDSFFADISEGTAHLAMHFDLESVVPSLTASLNEELESARDDLESDPTAIAAVPFFEVLFETAVDMISQLKSLSATLEVEGTDVHFAQFLKFRRGSKIQNALKEMAPPELALLDALPKQAFVSGGFEGKPELLIEVSLFWLKMLEMDVPEYSMPLKTLIEQTEDFYGALADEWAFTLDYNESLLPDYLVVYGLKDEQRARTYMEETFLQQLQRTMRVMRDGVGDMPQLHIYDGAHLGTPIMHNGVEIQTFVFPNFGAVFENMPEPASTLMPQEWLWSYAFHENRLLLAIGGPELIKAELDQQPETGETLADNPSYQKLTTMLGTDNNLLLGVSLMTAAKDLLPIIAKADPNAAPTMQLLSGILMNMPETYSIGFSAKAEEIGIRTKILFILGDFKQLIQKIAALTMQGGGQMQ